MDWGIAFASWGLSSRPFFGSLAPEPSALSAARTLFVDVEERGPEAMDVKERKPYRSLTRRRDAERRYTSSSADSEEGKAPQKSYSSSETLKAYDQDARLAYGGRVKDLVPQEAEEFCRAGEGGWGGCAPACVGASAGRWAGRRSAPGLGSFGTWVWSEPAYNSFLVCSSSRSRGSLA